MRVMSECYACLERLAKQTLGLCFGQRPRSCVEEKRITAEILGHLRKNFSPRTVPAVLFSRLNRQIKQQTRIGDPFLPRKTEEMHRARTVSRQLLAEQRPRSLYELLLFSVRGNSLDFFKPLEESIRHMHEPAALVAPGLECLEKKLRTPCRIIFFADNSGESFFDLPLVRYLGRKHHVTYVVKSRPVQNDLTLHDLKTSRMFELFPRVRGAGNDAVGIELNTLSAYLRSRLTRGDLVIAKGMGYYETFTELPHFRGAVFYLLMAKCRPVAQSLGVPLHSFVLLGPGRERRKSSRLRPGSCAA
jgi:hypothetical protein